MDHPDELRSHLAGARLYLCTDTRSSKGDLGSFLDAVLVAGVDVVQLREKNLEARHELAALEIVADAARRHGALFAVNDRADLAFAAGSDVLHLGQDDLPVAIARSICGSRILIGRSTHSSAQLHEAARETGSDYFCVGPCWETPTKPGRPASGLALLAEAAALDQPKPWFAIGGISLERLDEVLGAGARRVVVVRAITEAEDPGGAAAAFARRLAAAAGS